MGNDELSDQIFSNLSTIRIIDSHRLMEEIRKRKFDSSEEEVKRMHYISEKFFVDWLSHNIHSIAEKFNVNENVISSDMLKSDFTKLFELKANLPNPPYTDPTLDSNRERLRSYIRLAAISSNSPEVALNNTIDAIRNYIASMKKSVMTNIRFQVEAMLFSRAGAITNEICEKCGAPMKVVNPYGGDSYFLGCSEYPYCYNSKQLSVEIIESIPRVIDKWTQGDLEEALKRLLPIESHWRPSSYDEISTRIEFIDPILESLGWCTLDNRYVKKEFKTQLGRADYALFKDEQHLYAIVEAKKLYEDLSKHREQISNFLVATSAQYGILTNGFDWEIFNRDDEGKIQLTVAVMNIISDTDEETLSKIVELIRKR